MSSRWLGVSSAGTPVCTCSHPVGRPVAGHGGIRITPLSGLRRAARSLHVVNATPKSGDAPRTLKEEAIQSNKEVSRKLIAAFMERTKEDWPKLMVFSKTWKTLAEGVFEEMAIMGSEEQDPTKQLEIANALRTLRRTHEAIIEHDELLSAFEDADEATWEGLVAQFRPEMTQQFFEHLRIRVMAERDNENRREELAAIASRLITLAEAHDQVIRDEEAMDAAGTRLKELLETVGSLEEADRKIDEMAQQGTLDPAFLLTMAKAYSGVKESSMTRDEVKDVMAHLYFKAKEATARQQPPEVRILKYLLSVEDPMERRAKMESAFEPVPGNMEISEGGMDLLSTTPAALSAVIEAVLGAYDSKGAGTMIGEAAGLMDPQVIGRLREMQRILRKNFL